MHDEGPVLPEREFDRPPPVPVEAGLIRHHRELPPPLVEDCDVPTVRAGRRARARDENSVEASGWRRDEREAARLHDVPAGARARHGVERPAHLGRAALDSELREVKRPLLLRPRHLVPEAVHRPRLRRVEPGGPTELQLISERRRDLVDLHPQSGVGGLARLEL